MFWSFGISDSTPIPPTCHPIYNLGWRNRIRFIFIFSSRNTLSSRGQKSAVLVACRCQQILLQKHHFQVQNWPSKTRQQSNNQKLGKIWPSTISSGRRRIIFPLLNLQVNKIKNLVSETIGRCTVLIDSLTRFDAELGSWSSDQEVGLMSGKEN